MFDLFILLIIFCFEEFHNDETSDKKKKEEGQVSWSVSHFAFGFGFAFVGNLTDNSCLGGLGSVEFSHTTSV